MNDKTKLLKFTSKPQLKAIRKAVVNNQNYGRSRVKVFSSDRDIQDRVCVCVLLKNHTNYLEVAGKLWAKTQLEVTQELMEFYKAVVQLDASLKEACCYGMKRHMTKYFEYHKRGLKVA